MKTVTVQNRKFFADQYGSVYEIGATANMFFCKLNGRPLKTAVTQAIHACLIQMSK